MPISPTLAEFRQCPTYERRAASIHLHVDGERGPSSRQVSDAALRALFSLLRNANSPQLGFIMQSMFDNLDKLSGWIEKDQCCWLAQRIADWAQYQYRYVVPTWLVERLLENQNSKSVTPMHQALTAMITTVLVSPTRMINLSSSDIISNLTTVLIRRSTIDPEDSLIQLLEKCIASLGTHVYYSDQIQDLAVCNWFELTNVSWLFHTARIDRSLEHRWDPRGFVSRKTWLLSCSVSRYPGAFGWFVGLDWYCQ